MKSIVIAPHPDDEVLGVAGTILRRKSEGGDVAWVIVTGMAGNNLYENSQLESRRSEILKIKKLLTFDKVYELNLPAAKLDKIPSAEIVDLDYIINEN
jgi:LmbE family N-acetylglucosaminyl deacetylase